MTSDCMIRAPREEDLAALTALRIVWADPSVAPTAEEREEFQRALHAWMTRLGGDVVCRVAVADDRVVGMAWLVVHERVPNIGDLSRRTGDVQSVFVVPERRGRGIGRALVDSLLAEADDRGVPRVTVHSNSRAIPFYEGAGFMSSPDLLERRRPDAG